jgi:hypothetical protein
MEPDIITVEDNVHPISDVVSLMPVDLAHLALPPFQRGVPSTVLWSVPVVE